MLASSLIAHSQQHQMRVKTPPISFDSASRVVLQNMIDDDPTDTSEGGSVNGFRRWIDFYSNRVSVDAPADSNMLMPVTKALAYYMNNQFLYCNSNHGTFDGNWTCIGPFNDYYGPGITERQGRIDAVWVDPDNMAHILAGAIMGGLWETQDTGHTWQNISDPTVNNGSLIPGTMGVTQIVVNPLDNDYIYTVLNSDALTGRYAMGLAYSPDGGQTWNADDNFLSANQQMIIDYDHKFVKKLAYMPGTSKLFAISHNKVLLKETNSANWADITPTGLGADIIFTDLEFSVLNPGKVLVSTTADNNSCKIWIYNTGSSSWTGLSFSPPSGYYLVDATDKIQDMTVSSSDEVYLLFRMHKNSDGLAYTHLYQGFLNSTFLVLKSTDAILKSIETIHISLENDQVIYALVHNGVNSFYKSINEGASFSSIKGSTHPDARGIQIYLPTNSTNGIDDIVFGGSDGGVVMKKAGNSNFESITGAGLCVTQFHGMSNTDADERYITGGAQDNGIFSYISDKAIPWEAEGSSADNFGTKFANNGVTTAIHEYYNGNASLEFNGSNTTIGPMPDAGDYINPTCLICGQNNQTRPVYFDQDTIAYMGYHKIWQKAFSGSTWENFLNPNPRINAKVCDMIMSEPQHDTMYIAYRDESWPNDPLVDVEAMKLFRSFNATSNPATWTNITPAAVQWMRINDIETDQSDMRRLWIAFGNVPYWNTTIPPDSMTSRVFYSENFGEDYVDISKGLPCLPISKILYHKGDNKLFVATDVGVFSCDFNEYVPSDTLIVNGAKVNWSVTWKCFNNNLPPVIGSVIEFNHCADKLRLSTYGRGMWESPLHADPWHIPAEDVTVITSNTTWDRNKYPTGNIRITNNAKLTIENNGSTQTVLYMPKNGKITVEKGSRLVVDGARITNGCEDCFWYGIVAEGDKTVPQLAGTDPNHAVVEIKNDAIVEHARFAVNLYGGGIIRATESSFINNKKSIAFVDYDKFNNISAIRACQFYIDDNYKGHNLDYPFGTHISMWAVKGINIAGCGFYNWDTHAQNKGKASGIVANNAGFKLLPICTSNTYPCSAYQRNIFHGFRNGVNISGDLEDTHTDYITQAAFDSNTVGVRIVTKNDVTVVNSEFEIGNGLASNTGNGDILPYPNCAWNIGIFTYGAHRYILQENNFQGVATPNLGTVGTMTTNTASEYDNVIYKSHFQDLSYANLSARKNGYPSPGPGPSYATHGLQYQCNDFKDNAYDIYVSAYPVNNPDHGVAAHQGSNLLAAGNLFDGSTMNILNEGHGLAYFYNNTVTPSIPTNMAGDVWYNNIAPINSCASKFNDVNLETSNNTGPFTAPLAEMKVAWDSIKTRLNTVLNSYQNLIDGGNTAALLSALPGYSPRVMDSVLLSYSPYLSKEVAIAASDYADTTSLKTIALANPELLQDEEIFEYLTTGIAPPFSEYAISQFTAARNSISVRGEDEAHMGMLHTELSELNKQIIVAIKLDTNDTFYDSLLVWQRKFNTLTGEYSAVGHYFSLGDTTRAQEVLDSIEIKFALSANQILYYEGYKTMFSIMKRILADGRLLNDPDSADIADMNYLINNSIHEISVLAQKSYWATTLDPPVQDFYRTCVGDGWVLERKAPPQSNNPITPFTQLSSESPYLKVAPNPARELVHFNYSVTDAKGKLSIMVMSAVGQVVKQFSIDNKKGVIDWDTNNVPAGTYLYKLSDNRGTITTGKLVIIK